MDQLQRIAHKLGTDLDHLEHVIGEGSAPSNEQLDLMLGIAKRVRRSSTLLVRLIAAEREQLHSQEADKHNE